MAMKKYGMMLRSMQSHLQKQRVDNHRGIVAGANRGLFLNKIKLLFFVSVWSLVSITNSFAQNEFNEELPMLIFTDDICEIEITPYELDLLLEASLDFYNAYESRMRCEPPPAQYKCQGCRDKNATFYECLHRSMDPNTPCDTQYCIKTEVFYKSCYVSNRGLEDCRVVQDSNSETSYAFRYLIRTRNPCRSSRQTPYTLFKVWVGCPLCEEMDVEVRCTVTSCPGEIVGRTRRPHRYLCMPTPCPPP